MTVSGFTTTTAVRHYGLSPAYVGLLARHGLVVSALADDGAVEADELPHHLFFLATLFQPQVGSVAGQPIHPVISAFAAAV
jgi:CTP synthase (UTP-ammonia lyase)